MSPYRRPAPFSKMARAQAVAQRLIRQHLTFEQKIEVIDFYHAHRHLLPLTKMVEPLRKKGFLTICHTTIRRLVDTEERIRHYVNENPKCLESKRETLVTHPQVEEALACWIEQKLNNNIRLTGEVLIEKAHQFCNVFGIPQDERISFSYGWLNGFKRRHKLHRVTFHGKRASAPVESVIAERARLRPILAGYHPRDRYNMDETAVYGLLAPSAGLGTHDTGGLKPNRDRLTVSLCANEDGLHKLPILYIGHAAHPQCFPHSHPPRRLGYWYFNNKTAWMKYDIFQDFLTELNESMRRQNRHILLLCDNASLHKRDAATFPTLYPHVRVKYLSPNLTPWVQPMDAGIIKSFKSQYQRQYVALTIQCSDEGHLNPYKINQLEVMQMANTAWERVSGQTIRNCWRHTGISLPHPSEPEGLFVYYPEAYATSVAADLALELGSVPEYNRPAVYDMLEAIAFDCPTEEDLTVEQI